MKKLSLLLCSLLLSIFLSGCSLIGLKKIPEEELQIIAHKVQKSQIIVLDIYHKHCETCKYIEPIIKKLESNYLQNPNIVFLKYDLSNPFTIYNSKLIAKTIGIENIYKSQRFSGVVFIIDSKTKKILDNLIAEYNIDTYTKTIEKRLKENAT